MNNIYAMVKQEKKFLLIIFVLAFTVRALFFIFFLSQNNNYWTGDSQEYHNVAQHLALGNGITNPDQTAHFLRLPGYPLFLAMGYKIFNFNIQKTLWIQLVLASLIPLLLFCLSLVLFPQNILLAQSVSFFVATLHLGFALFSGLFMSETLFMFFFLLFCLFF